MNIASLPVKMHNFWTT